MHITIRLLIALVLGSTLGAQTQPRSPDTLVRGLQDRYETIRDFSADFVHTYEGGVLRKKAVERGTLLVKKPGKMRWNYTSPEQKIFVSDGRQIYSYIPADKQVIVSPMPARDEATTAVLFLVGHGNLTRDFSASEMALPSAPADTIGLKLTPRRAERDYESLAVGVSRDTMQIRVLIAKDRQGGTSTFQFSNIKENIRLSDKTFTFKIPRGVDVIRSGGTTG